MAIEISKHITQLLAEHDCVIVPGFGALLLHYKPAKIDRSTGVLSPPSKEIAFNDKLTSNDWTLINAIATKSHINVDIAEEQVIGFVKLIRGKLLLNKQYSWENVGTFYFNDNNLRFEADNRVNYLGDSFGLPQVFVGKSDNQKLGSTAKIKQRPPMNSNEVGAFTSNAPSKVSNISAIWVWILVPVLLLAGSAGFMWENRSNEAMSSFNPFSSFGEFKPKAKVIEKDKNFNYEDPLGENTSGEKLDKSEAVNIESKEENVVIQDPIAKEEIVESSEPIDQEKIKKSAVIVPSGAVIGEKTGRCYIILASFSTLDQAEKVRQKLEDEGLDETKIIEPHDHKNIFRVSIADYDKKVDALKRADELREKYGDKLWVHIY